MKLQDQSPYSNHEAVLSLLPWYLNGSLAASEFEFVKHHLRVCLTCRKELVAQEALVKTLQRTPLMEISTKPSFERLMSRIHDEDGLSEKTNPDQDLRIRWLADRISSVWTALTSKRFAVACVGGLLAISIASIVRWMPMDTVRTYYTAANPGNLELFTHDDVRVVFADHVTEQDINNLLTSIHGRIVDGPTAHGVYTIRIIGNAESGRLLSQCLEKLRGNKMVVFAERALPQPTGQNETGG